MGTGSFSEILLNFQKAVQHHIPKKVLSIRYGVIKKLPVVPFVGLKCSPISKLGLDFKILYPVIYYHSYMTIIFINHKMELDFVGEIRYFHATTEKMLLL
jgi:hypothetical protein